MPKSYGWEQLVLSILSQAKAQDWNGVTLSSRQRAKIASKSLLMLGFISLWWWNWQLLLATGSGIGLMWLTYKVSSKQWRKLWQTGIDLLTGQNRKLILAVSSGSVGGLFIYMMSAIWASTENQWLAAGSILQVFTTLIILVLVGWQITQQASDRNKTKFDRLLQDLSAADALKRFIAVRQLTHLAQKKALDREHKLHLIEYFQFMLTQHQESAIEEALLDGLDILGFSSFDGLQSPNALTPIELKHSLRENVS